MKKLSEDVDIFKKSKSRILKSQNFQNLENLKNHVFGVFRWICQEKISDNWIDVEVDQNKNITFENSILEKAKKIRLSNQ